MNALYAPPAGVPQLQPVRTAPPFLPESVFAQRFRIVRLLREDYIGSIYEVRELVTERSLSLRILAASLGPPAELMEPLRSLLELHLMLPDERICPYLELGQEEESKLVWLVSDWPRGQTLETWLRAQGALDPTCAWALLHQVAQALSDAAPLGLYHGDLRPQSILVVENGQAGAPPVTRLIGVGLHAALSSLRKGDGRSGQGSPLWLSPEQIRGSNTVGPSTDVWSLGLLAFRLLTGESYWRAGKRRPYHPLQVLREVSIEDLEPASVRAQKLGVGWPLPLGFDEWLARCLARDPAERFPSVADACSALPPCRSSPRSRVPGGSLPTKESALAGIHAGRTRQSSSFASPRMGLRVMGSAAAITMLLFGGFRLERADRRVPAATLAPPLPAAAGAAPVPAPPPQVESLPPLGPPRIEAAVPIRKRTVVKAKAHRELHCGTPEQCHASAQALIEQGDERRAAPLFAESCQRGYGEACRFLGEMHERGLGVMRNAAGAQRLFQRSCTLGSAPACARYQESLHARCQKLQAGACTELGQFLKQNPQVTPQHLPAEEYLMLGCKHGDARACPSARPAPPSPRKAPAREPPLEKSGPQFEI